MKLYKPSSLALFQLFTAWVLVAIFTCPGDAMHHGPMLILKGGAGNSHMAAAGLVAAGLAIKLLSEMGKHGGSQHHQHHGGGGGGGYGGGGLAMMHSFASHDGNLGQYGYTQEMHGGWMRR